MRNRKRKHGFAPWVALAVLVLLAAGILAARQLVPQRVFVLEEKLSHLGGGDLPRKAEDLSVLDWPLDVLQNNPRVTIDQSMMLINAEHRITDEDEFPISPYAGSDVEMNECIMPAYAKLAALVEEQFDTKLYVRSAWRSEADQQRQLAEEGDDIAAPIGASEHQAGLALDVYVPGFAGMGFLKSEAGRYVNRNCWQQGFIIRYPYYGKSETGISYEPWHIRYVGAPHAEIIMDNSMTLEGYCAYYEMDTWYKYGEYYVSHQTGGDTISVPEHFSEAVLSPDHMGGWWLTVKMD